MAFPPLLSILVSGSLLFSTAIELNPLWPDTLSCPSPTQGKRTNRKCTVSLSYLPDLIQSLPPIQMSVEFQTLGKLPDEPRYLIDTPHPRGLRDLFSFHPTSLPMSFSCLQLVNHVMSCQFQLFDAFKSILFFCFLFLRTSCHLFPILL